MYKIKCSMLFLYHLQYRLKFMKRFEDPSIQFSNSLKLIKNKQVKSSKTTYPWRESQRLCHTVQNNFPGSNHNCFISATRCFCCFQNTCVLCFDDIASESEAVNSLLGTRSRSCIIFVLDSP